MTYYTGSPIDYTAVASTPGYLSSDHTYQWTFDDGTQQSGSSVSQTWSTPGDHSATVLATNNTTNLAADAVKTISVSNPPPVYHYIVTTLSGVYNTPGFVDGNGATSRYDELYHLSINQSNGDIYSGSLDLSTPYDGHCVRKITTSGDSSTIMQGVGYPTAQSGVPIDGTVPGTARSGWPFSASYHSVTGDLYISDSGGVGSALRRVTSGISSLFAGSYTLSGSAMGTGAAARFTGLRNIVFDTPGTTGYVVDLDRHILCAVTIPGAVVTTLAGLSGSSGHTDGTGSAARFNQPRGICIAADGNIYMADTENSSIRCITPAGVVTTVAGSYLHVGHADGIGALAQFNRPYALVESTPGVFYVSDTGNSLIRKMVVSAGVGTVTTVVGQVGSPGGTDGHDISASINPLGIVYYSGALYVANGSCIRKITDLV